MEDNVIIIGDASVTALGLLRSIPRDSTGIHLVETTIEHGLAWYSNRPTSKMHIPGGFASGEVKEFFRKSSELRNAFIFPASDDAVNFLIDHQDELVSLGFITTESSFSSRELLSKSRMRKHALAAGFDVPRRYSFNDQTIEFPVIIKPKSSLKFGKESFNIAMSHAQLAEMFPVEGRADFYIEEFIVNQDLSMFEFFGYRTRSGVISDLFPIVKIRQFPELIGSSSFIKSTKLPSFNGSIARLLTSLEYVGFFDLELKYCAKRKKYYFIEINFRAGAPISLARAAGSNMLYSYLKDQRFSYHEPKKSTYWMNEQSEIAYFLKDWDPNFFKIIFQAKGFAVFEADDLGPFLQMLCKRITKIFRRKSLQSSRAD